MGCSVDEQIKELVYVGSSGKIVLVVVYDESQSIFASDTMAEVGATGIYEYDWTPDAVGVWLVVITCSSPIVNVAHKYHVGMGQEDDIEDKIDIVDSKVDDILVDTGTTLPTTLATIQTDLDNPSQYKADVTNLDVAVSSRAPANEYDTQLDQNLSNTEDNIRGSDNDNLKAISDQIDGVPTTTEAEGYVENAEDGGNLSHEITTANDKTETEMFEFTEAGIYDLTVSFDLDELETAGEGGTVTFKIYNRVDGTNYPDIPNAKFEYVVGDEVEYPSFLCSLIHGYVKMTVECSDDVTATRTINYRRIKRDLGS